MPEFGHTIAGKSLPGKDYLETSPARPHQTSVRDLMTPAVFSVTPQTPAAQVVEELLALDVQRLFVIDNDGTLVGSIRARDVLSHLQPDTEWQRSEDRG